MSWVMHISPPAMSREHIPTDQRQPASASTVQADSERDRSPISNSVLPTGSAAPPPGIMVDGGAGIMPDPAGPKPHYRGGKNVTGNRHQA